MEMTWDRLWSASGSMDTKYRAELSIISKNDVMDILHLAFEQHRDIVDRIMSPGDMVLALYRYFMNLHTKDVIKWASIESMQENAARDKLIRLSFRLYWLRDRMVSKLGIHIIEKLEKIENMLEKDGFAPTIKREDRDVVKEYMSHVDNTKIPLKSIITELKTDIRGLAFTLEAQLSDPINLEIEQIEKELGLTVKDGDCIVGPE